MTPSTFIETALLMGLFALAGGAYGTLYAIGRLRSRPGLVWVGRMCCVLATACAIAVAVLTPLEIGWKLLILVSASVYVIIPPMTWRYLERLHAQEECNQ